MFDGAYGYIGIALYQKIVVTHVTVDHIGRELFAEFRSAPRRMIFWIYIEDDDTIARLRYHRVENPLHPLWENGEFPGRLGERFLSESRQFRGRGMLIPVLTLEYDVNSIMEAQTFSLNQAVVDMNLVAGIVLLEIVDNWGATNTCLYRVRVHGKRRIASDESGIGTGKM